MCNFNNFCLSRGALRGVAGASGAFSRRLKKKKNRHSLAQSKCHRNAPAVGVRSLNVLWFEPTEVCFLSSLWFHFFFWERCRSGFLIYSAGCDVFDVHRKQNRNRLARGCVYYEPRVPICILRCGGRRRKGD